MNKIKKWLPLLTKYKYIFDAANVLTILSKKIMYICFYHQKILAKKC